LLHCCFSYAPDEKQDEHGIGNGGRQVHHLTTGLHPWTNQREASEKYAASTFNKREEDSQIKDKF